MPDSWYSVVSGRALEQGDILQSCPILRVDPSSYSSGDDEAAIVEETHDVIVLTQTCDLENDKVDEVLVAAVLSYPDLVKRDGAKNPNLKSSRFRQTVIDGLLPPYSLIPKRDEAPSIEWSLVDFHNLFSMPKEFAAGIAEAGGDRLRLVPPYKEHLAQAFARYIMRVGLPSGLDDFATVAV